MRYITEDMLRQEYRKNPFEEYGLPEDSRLTPGAQQFLTDFQIKFLDSNKKNPDDRKNVGFDQTDYSTDEIMDDKVTMLSLKIKNMAYKIHELDKKKSKEIFKLGDFFGTKDTSAMDEILGQCSEIDEFNLIHLKFEPDSRLSTLTHEILLTLAELKQDEKEMLTFRKRDLNKEKIELISGVSQRLFKIRQFILKVLMEAQEDGQGD